jgi:nickel superoxide dismutase
MKMKKGLWILVLLSVTLFAVSPAWAHCEIPCGIYDDRTRVQLIAEHTGTIEKSMRQITELQKANAVNYNQLVRWIMNKDHHADEIQEIVMQYFMTQRIKPDSDQYARKIAVLHQMLIAAMKCKQTTDLKYVKELNDLRQTFEQLYFK